ncbi:MAG TPA: hypothetical protein VHT03_10450 [Rhizomicrobium sp.]|jgi:hypothetical protein|nr:hypothetical protein [Rhizomicrobium sp.]
MTQFQNGRKVLLQLVDISDFIECRPGHIYVKATDFGAIPNSPGPVTVAFSMHFTGHRKTTIKVPTVIR